MEVYDQMAEFYDLIYGDELDLDFYMLEARNARGPVLEVGCGTGRILLRLLEEGIDASGVDISERMIEELKRKAREKGIEPEVYIADMQDFKIGKRFKLIAVPYRSFLHLTDEQKMRKALENFFGHLESGGRLIIHSYNPSEEELEMTDEFHHYESEDIESKDGKSFKVEWFLKYDPKSNQGHYRITMDAREGKKEYEMMLFFIDEKRMHELLKGAGFKNIRLYCGFDYGEYSDDCREAIWIAEK